MPRPYTTSASREREIQLRIQEAKEWRYYCWAFLKHNRLPLIQTETSFNKVRAAGHYFRPKRGEEIGLVRIYIMRCRSRRDGTIGSVGDRTIAGVTAHEIGHHIDWLLTRRTDGIMIRTYRKLIKGTIAVTAYGNTDTHEDFAEAMRIFILNPDLLRNLSRMRYEFFADTLCLKSLETRTWQEVLSSSPGCMRVAKSRIRDRLKDPKGR